MRTSLAVLAICAAATQANAQSRLLDAITGVDREGAFREGVRQRAELDRMLAEAEAARAAADLARADREALAQQQEIQAELAALWERLGIPSEEAQLIAVQWHWTESQDAIVASLRRRGLERVGDDLRAALDRYDYLLANQLLLAYIVVAQDEPR
jgi:hypothetical protein